jgi:predicted Rossmann-fold nucleotide-binding protein
MLNAGRPPDVDDLAVAIIGTRSPDHRQERKARFLAYHLSHHYGCRIKTGGAYGIDQAAMLGARIDMLDICLPWASYNKEIIPKGAHLIIADRNRHAEWFESVENYHPAPDKLTNGARSLHARNFGVIQPAHLVIAFPNADGGGGTGQGIRIAEALNIPVMQFNKGAEAVLMNQTLLTAVNHLGLIPGAGLVRVTESENVDVYV